MAALPSSQSRINLRLTTSDILLITDAFTCPLNFFSKEIQGHTNGHLSEPYLLYREYRMFLAGIFDLLAFQREREYLKEGAMGT